MKSTIKTTILPQKSLIRNFRNWQLLLLPIILFFSGCRSTENLPDKKKEVKNSFPYEKTFTSERKSASRKLAQEYINALNQSLKTGDFLHLKKVLPARIRAKKAREIFQSLQTTLAKLGHLESCEYFGMLDCTFFVDHFWKYRFIKNTGDPRLPRQSFEVLYRVRLIHPTQKPQIINADFMFR